MDRENNTDHNRDQWLFMANNVTAPASLNRSTANSDRNFAPTNNNLHGEFDSLDFDNICIELEFNRLNLSSPPPSPAYLAPPLLPHAAAYGYNPRSLSNGIDFSYADPQLFDDEIQRIRVQNAARMFELPYGLDYYDSSSYFNGYRASDSTRCSRIFNDVIGFNYSSAGARQGLNLTSNFGDMRGRILMVAKDPQGCLVLQEKFEHGTRDEINIIFNEIKGHICELMIDKFGNFVAQKMFEVCNEEQFNQLLLVLFNYEMNLYTICCDDHGTKAMQHLIDQLRTSEQRCLVTSALRRIVVRLTKDQKNGCYFVHHCLKVISTYENKDILSVIADNCLDIAIDKYGCCFIQQFLVSSQGEPLQLVVTPIASNALFLSKHPHGNYVVQCTLGLNIPQVTSAILAQFSRHFVSLSMDKFGSNVVEKCLEELDRNQVHEIVNEILWSPYFLKVLLDPFGNYVAQSAISFAKGKVRQDMIKKVYEYYAFLHSHPYGKRVLTCAKTSKQRV